MDKTLKAYQLYYNLTNELSKNTVTDLEIIKAKLMKSYYIDNDDFKIKFGGDRYN